MSNIVPVLFSGDPELIKRVSDFFIYIDNSKLRCAQSASELEQVLDSTYDSPSMRYFLILDTLYLNSEVRRMITEHLKLDPSFTCLSLCEHSDSDLFAQFTSRTSRLEKPFSTFDFSEAFFDLRKKSELVIEPGFSGANLRMYAYELLYELGIPVNVSGFDCIRQALVESVMDERLRRGCTKAIYDRIARSFDIDSTTVERSIRRAINISWTRGRLQASKLFAAFTEHRPTAAEFLSISSECLAVRVQFNLGKRCWGF